MGWALPDRPNASTKLCVAEFWHSGVGHKVATAVLKAEAALPFPSPPKTCCSWIAPWSCPSPQPPLQCLCPWQHNPEQGIKQGPRQPRSKHHTFLARLILTPHLRHVQGLLEWNILHSCTLLCETWTGGSMAFAGRSLAVTVFLLCFPSIQGCTSSSAFHGEKNGE